MTETTGRGQVHTVAPSTPHHGTARMWRRTIRGTAYQFTVVNMPNGEVRWFVSRFNGYIGGPSFGCAWTPVRKWTFRPTDAHREAGCANYCTPSTCKLGGAR